MKNSNVSLCVVLLWGLSCGGGGGGVDARPAIDGGSGIDAVVAGADAMVSTLGDPGDHCTDPAIVPIQIPAEIPYADVAQTTCNDVTRYATTCMGPFWSAGGDVVYQLEVTTPTSVEIQLLPNDTAYAGLALDDACPLSEATDSCIAMSLADGSTDPLTLGCQALTPGTYFVMVSVFPSPDCIPDFDLLISPC